MIRSTNDSGSWVIVSDDYMPELALKDEEYSSENFIIGQVTGLRCNPGLSTQWSFEEETIMNEGLTRYAEEPNITKYIKIASVLHQKTVRDVALRCSWINKGAVKLRMAEELYMRKTIKVIKEKLLDYSSNLNNDSTSPYNVASYSQLIQNEVPIFDPAAKNLLEENAEVICQVSANIETMQIENNPALSHHMKNTFVSIQNWYDEPNVSVAGADKRQNY